MDLIVLVLSIINMFTKSKAMSIVDLIIACIGFVLWAILFTSEKDKTKKRFCTELIYIGGIICSIVGICVF